MFLSLFYLLRANRLKVSLDEWLMLLEGMRKGLHGSTLDGFYTLCRAVVVTSEVDFDRFDQVFLEFFRGVEPQEQLPEELRKWLEHPELTREDIQRLQKFTGLSEEEIEALFARRLQDQKEEHNGGRKWIGTDGYTAFGNQGERMGGIRWAASPGTDPPIGWRESGGIGIGAQTVPLTPASSSRRSGGSGSCLD